MTREKSNGCVFALVQLFTLRLVDGVVEVDWLTYDRDKDGRRR